MKIFLVTTFFHPVTGGVESHVESLALELTKLGHAVTVLTSDSTKNGPRASRQEKQYRGFKIRRFLTWFSLSYFHKFYPGLIWYLLRHDFDVVHVHGFRKFESYVALLIAKLRKRKVIVTTHNPFTANTRSRFNKFLVSLQDKTIGVWFARYFDKVIAIVKSEKKILTTNFKIPAERIVIIPNGLDESFFTPGSPAQFFEEERIDPKAWKGIVAGIGRLNYVKGFQNLKTAVKELPETLFYIAGGDDGYFETLKTESAGFPNVIMPGVFIASDKVKNILAAADILVMPSLHEPFGIVLLEALAQGCPVIVTERGGAKEFLPERVGFILDPEDQPAWKDKIQYLLEHPVIRKKMAKEGKIFVEDFKWDKLVLKVLQAYK